MHLEDLELCDSMDAAPNPRPRSGPTYCLFGQRGSGVISLSLPPSGMAFLLPSVQV